MRRAVLTYFAFMVLMLVAACHSSTDDASVPLPKAYPRLALPVADSLVTVDSLPVEVRVNPHAAYSIISKMPAGLTVSYPSIKSNIYFTFIKPTDTADRERIIKARQERISLNLNGIPAETIHDTEGKAVIVLAKSASGTPVQLLAEVDPYIVTATAFIDDSDISASYDSIAPVINFLYDDMARAIPVLNFSR